MKKSELIFSAILVPVDYFMVFLAGILAYHSRFLPVFTEIRPVVTEINYQQYVTVLFFVPVIFIIIFALSGLYAIKVTRKLVNEMISIFVACSAAISLVIIIIFFQRELFSSRFIVLIGWILIVLMVMIGRLLVRGIQRFLLKKGVGIHNVIIIGRNSTTEDIVKQLHKNPLLGYSIVSRFNNFSDEVKDEVLKKIETSAVDEIIQSDIDLPKNEALEISF